jgi:hypothetical protein
MKGGEFEKQDRNNLRVFFLNVMLRTMEKIG